VRTLYVCVTQQHDPALLGLAALICCLGSWSAFALGREGLRLEEARARLIWGAAGAVATVSAIWATHFVAMLAFEPGMPYRLNTGRTVLSFVVPLVLVGAGVTLVATVPRPVGRAMGGGVVGIAISAMHYTGMSAYEVQGHLAWSLPAVVSSVLAGTLLPSMAVLLPYRGSRIRGVYGPLLFALAVCLAHLLGMSAVTIEFDPGAAEPDGRVDDRLLAMLVTSVSLLVAGFSIAAAWASGRVRRQRASEERQLRDLADISVDGLLICRGETIVRSNRSIERTLSCGSRDLAGRSIADVVLGIGSVPVGREADAYMACPRAGKIPVRVTGQDIVISGRQHFVVAVRDQRERLHSEAKMMLLAHHDPLTGLANRLSFNQALAGRCLLPGSGKDNFALLMLDLDRFKAVNDTFGHGVGDELLRRAARRLRRAVREGDLVARLGGDEFAIVAGDGNLDVVRRIARDVIDLIERPFVIDGHVLSVGTSVGIAIASADGDEPGRLSQSADLALYRAKQEGGGTFRFFEAEMSARAQARRALELDLRRAAARQEFEVFYQPQVDPRTGEFEGAEALVRWRHPRRGLVSPSEFIPLAEEIGLIGTISDWVLRTACTEAARWPAHLSVAVNLSPVQFRDLRLAAKVAETLADAGLPGARLELEITESALLQDDGHTLQTLHALRALGVRISMDDFGTGYSSLSYLRRFPFDKIKIDQSFIRQVPGDTDSIAIVQAITSLGAKLGMTVTAEGVETPEQRAFTVAEGCDQIQGYLIGRPVPASQVRELLTAAPAPRAVA
jgi:diguanylate cyclase (GGDEF)-like protein